METNQEQGEFCRLGDPDGSFTNLETTGVGNFREQGQQRGDTGVGLRDFAGRTGRALSDSFNLNNARIVASKVNTTLDWRVRRNPFVAVGIAFGLGFLAAAVARRN